MGLPLERTERSDGIRGQFRATGTQAWREVGECSLPASNNPKPKLSLQFYQGAEHAEHWARVTDFRVVRFPSQPDLGKKASRGRVP